MEKKRALGLLREWLDEIPDLKAKNYDNQEFKLWVSKLTDTIKASLDKDDYNKFIGAWPHYHLTGDAPPSAHQERYQKEINLRDTAIKEIIQKYEILGIEPTESNTENQHETTFIKTPIKAFISHGKGGGALLKLEKFIRELGIDPIIVKDQASSGRSVDDKVQECLGKADFVIIFATGDDIIKKTKDKEIRQPRQNVIHEIGLAQTTHPNKIIYLLEERADFPSNINPKVYERFARQSLDDAFTAIVRELRNWGFLRVVNEEKHN